MWIVLTRCMLWLHVRNDGAEALHRTHAYVHTRQYRLHYMRWRANINRASSQYSKAECVGNSGMLETILHGNVASHKAESWLGGVTDLS